jgi:3-phenylpropionate/cinnamic acid dioxygenase small subunit
MPANASSPHLAAVAEAFLVREARLLDEGRYEEWLALFTDDAWYWVPSQPGQNDPKSCVSLMYDDRRLLEIRVRRLANRHLLAQQPPSRTCRTVANVTVEEGEDPTAGLTIRSKLLMVEFRRDNQRIFAGTSWHRLKSDAEEWRISWKKVELINSDGVLEGLVVPF